MTPNQRYVFRQESIGVKLRRYPDGCYAVVVRRRRGPVAHSKVEALRRYYRSGLIAAASKH